LEILDYK